MASPKKISIVCLPGDGVGPEVVGEAVKVLQKVAAHRSKALNVEFEFKNELIGLAALEKTGMYMRTHTCHWDSEMRNGCLVKTRTGDVNGMRGRIADI